MRKFTKFYPFIAPLIAVASLLAAACSGPAPQWRKASGAVWHTLYSVTYLSDRQLDDSIVATLRAVELSLSPFNPESTVSRINRGETDQVDSTLAMIFAESQRINRLSGGMFDPTVAPLVSYWGFGHERPDSTASLDSVMSLVGLSDCRLDGLTLTKKHPLTQFNFSAITKGFGCDAVGQMLRRNGCSDYLVEIGGEIAASGLSPRGSLWSVMVDAPIDCADSIVHTQMTTLDLTDCGVATSGNYRNYRQTAAGKVSHTISPVTGRPVSLDSAAVRVLSATVVAPTAMTADALATAAMLLPPDSSFVMARRAGASKLILAVSTPTDSLRILSQD